MFNTNSLNTTLRQTLPTDLNDEFTRLSRRLDEAISDLEKAAVELAHAEHDYSQAKATNFLSHQSDSNGNKNTVAKIEAIVSKECSRQQLRAYLARGMEKAMAEKVKSVRAQISALQSISAALRAEMEFSGKGN
jgi:hypothetical protein